MKIYNNTHNKLNFNHIEIFILLSKHRPYSRVRYSSAVGLKMTKGSITSKYLIGSFRNNKLEYRLEYKFGMVTETATKRTSDSKNGG